MLLMLSFVRLWVADVSSSVCPVADLRTITPLPYVPNQMLPSGAFTAHEMVYLPSSSTF